MNFCTLVDVAAAKPPSRRRRRCRRGRGSGTERGKLYLKVIGLGERESYPYILNVL